jgi:hypothetical protein
MACVDYRASAGIKAMHYGRAASKAAAMEWVGEVVRSLDVWDPAVGFVSLGKLSPAGAVLLWPHIRFTKVPAYYQPFLVRRFW